MQPIRPRAYRQIVVLTGAGVSAPSGLPTYRGPGGLWQDKRAEELASAQSAASRLDEVWSLFGPMRARVLQAEPNPAHLALARFQQRAPSTVLLTQNVDGLHQRAGSEPVVELHGSLLRSRCTGCAEVVRDEVPHAKAPPCPKCGQPLRPDVTLFEEPLDVDVEWQAKKALRECDLFLAVGTSANVAPASSFVRWADVNGARTILVNLEPLAAPNPAYRETYFGPAEQLLPQLLADPG